MMSSYERKNNNYMILVLLGTQHNEFKRLLEKIEYCIDYNIINEEVIVQAGITKYKTNKIKIFDFISKDELEKYVDDANFVITHGGVGSITIGLEKNKKVIAVPRLHEFNEHVNNHQKQIVEHFNNKKYLIGINDLEELPDALTKIKNFIPKKYVNSSDRIVEIIDNYIKSL